MLFEAFLQFVLAGVVPQHLDRNILNSCSNEYFFEGLVISYSHEDKYADNKYDRFTEILCDFRKRNNIPKTQAAY